MGGLGPGVYAKMLELLKEVVPKATRIAMLINPTFPLHAAFGADAESAARSLKVTLRPVELRSPEEIDGAFATIAREKVDALLILGQPFLFGHGARVAKMAIEQRLPAMIPFVEVARDGVLMSYGSRIIDDLRRLPHYIDRILKGAKPGELPVEQPTPVLPHHQPENREGDRPHRAAFAAAASGPGDRVKRRGASDRQASALASKRKAETIARGNSPGESAPAGSLET